MNTKNVYIIVGLEFTKEKIVQELRKENYDYNFVFSKDLSNNEERNYHLDLSNEVWLFGTCVHNIDYGLAEMKNKDFWIMG